jgi:hypothetical protein
MLPYLYDDHESVPLSFLRALQDLVSYSLLAADGEIGRIIALFFDDATGAIRYLMVASPDWLQGQPVLISPVAVGEVSDSRKTITIELTREQIASAPRFKPEMPITRAYEQAYFEHYNWPPYWEQASGAVKRPAQPSVDSLNDDVGLCSSQNLTGVDVVADQCIVGQLEHMIVDIQYWQLRYLGIKTRGFAEDKALLINLAWIERMDLQRGRVTVNMHREAIQHAPSFEAGKPISRAYEEKLFDYHRR